MQDHAAPPLRIVLAAFGFPPAVGPGVARPLAWANHLAARGHDVTVLTAHPDTQRRCGMTSERDVYLHPKVNVLRLGARGLDRLAELALRTRTRRLFDLVLSPELGWGSAVATWLARHASPTTTVITTSGPPAALYGALAARSVCDFVWMADYRDPWVLADSPMPTAAHLALYRALDSAIHRRADGLLYTSYIDLTNALRAYGVSRDRGLVVRNGIEEGMFDRPGDSSPPPTIAYCGNLYVAPETPRGGLSLADRLYAREIAYDYSTYSLVPLARAIKEARRLSGRDIKLEVIGAISPATVARAMALAGDTSGGWASTSPYMSKSAAAERCRGVAALYLPVAGRMDGKPCGWLPQKTFELLATDRPILASAPPGEMRSLVQTSQGVYFLDGPVEQDAAAVLRAIDAAPVRRIPRLWRRASQARQVEGFARRLLRRRGDATT